MKSNNYSESVNDALKKVVNLEYKNAVIGDPIITPSGTTVIPVCKISIGLAKGGGEFGKITSFCKNKSYPKTDAGGGVVSVKPCGFLVEKGKNIKYVSVPKDYMDKTIDYALQFLEKQNEK